jgi:hypothetical protein
MAQSVYVVTVVEDNCVVEQEVYTTLDVAYGRCKDLIGVWGAPNVCLASRELRVTKATPPIDEQELPPGPVDPPRPPFRRFA